MSTQNSPRRATSPESSPVRGYADAPGPQQEENDDVVFLLSVPRRCRLHPRGPQTTGLSSSGGAADNPIVVADDEEEPSTEEARAADNVVTISDDEDEVEEQPNAPPPSLATTMPERELNQPPVLAVLPPPVLSLRTPTMRPLPPTFLGVATSGSDPHHQPTHQRLGHDTSES